MILIDTSAWIEFFRRMGDREVKARVAGYIDLGEAAYCGPVQFELLAGARESELATIRKAFSFSRFLEFPVQCWERAAELEKTLRRTGITIPRDDIFVAAVALHHKVGVYTTDPHFKMVRDAAAPALELA